MEKICRRKEKIFDDHIEKQNFTKPKHYYAAGKFNLLKPSKLLFMFILSMVTEIILFNQLKFLTLLKRLVHC